jgi:hypothetical protein
MIGEDFPRDIGLITMYPQACSRRDVALIIDFTERWREANRPFYVLTGPCIKLCTGIPPCSAGSKFTIYPFTTVFRAYEFLKRSYLRV